MRNHVKQMLRAPAQSILIVVLVMIVTMMLVAGSNFWVTSDRIVAAYEEDFITIGTVTQKPDAVEEVEEWDAEKKDFTFRKVSRYNRYMTTKDLKFPELSYLAEPEKRDYWGSYMPEYVHGDDLQEYHDDDFVIVAEFSPLEDCIPDESVKIKITKILGNSQTLVGSVGWFCDHYNRNPKELKADKTYVAKMTQRGWTHGNRWEESGKVYSELEYFPTEVTPTLYTSEGKQIEDLLEMQSIYEVTEGFYGTVVGKRLLAVANQGALYRDTQPVVGTNSTELLMPFYERSAWVYEGRYPTEEEYAEGSHVCLAPRGFAENNHLTVGSQVMTRLYYTCPADMADVNFMITGGGGYGFSLLDFDGELLSPFEEEVYTIVGLYDYTPAVKGLGRDELIVPLNSVEKKTENMVQHGAMTDGNTSFRIENGTVADFLENSAKNGADNLIFTFYDRGYSALMAGIHNLRNMSVALLIMGSIAAVILTLQIAHIYIKMQSRRIFVERLLGMSRKQCRNICLACILILLILGIVPGVAAGMAVSKRINMEDMGQEDFNRKYSNLGLAVDTEIDLSGQSKADIAVSCMMGGLVLVLGIGISDIKLKNILKGELLYQAEDGMVGKSKL